MKGRTLPAPPSILRSPCRCSGRSPAWPYPPERYGENNGLTGILTNLMADGPAAASVGPITLNMAGLVHPGTTFLPFMAMSTAVASSFAYRLIIGTPPNAIVYASGYLEPKDYLRVGIPVWIIANIMLLALTLGYWGFRGFGDLAGF